VFALTNQGGPVVSEKLHGISEKLHVMPEEPDAVDSGIVVGADGAKGMVRKYVGPDAPTQVARVVDRRRARRDAALALPDDEVGEPSAIDTSPSVLDTRPTPLDTSTRG
jgi:2-polyprenyl-6-methoxyphenol hydroxylase-like FAD-dependent oxidoreductase